MFTARGAVDMFDICAAAGAGPGDPSADVAAATAFGAPQK
jgi:hypothetical protein